MNTRGPDVLVYELDPTRAAPRVCFLCLDPKAVVFVAREGQAHGVRGICAECISCLVSAGLQGRVYRHLGDDSSELGRDS